MRNGLRINAGSGQRPFANFINLDIQEKWRQPALDKGGEFLLGDMNSLPFPDGSASLIVSHHCLEHAHCGEGARFVKEAHRVLRPGGSLLVFVPDMLALAKRYVEGGLTTQVYMTNVYGAYLGDPHDCHMWGYDRGSLYDFLRSCAPWQRVKRFDWRAILGMDAARDFWILDAEAVK